LISVKYFDRKPVPRAAWKALADRPDPFGQSHHRWDPSRFALAKIQQFNIPPVSIVGKDLNRSLLRVLKTVTILADSLES